MSRSDQGKGVFGKRMFCGMIDSTASGGIGKKKKKTKAGTVPVYLNVYDLTSINGYAYWFGLGVYHSGVQVHGVEYAFGAHGRSTTGIFEVVPKQCAGFTFRKSILIGRTDMSPNEVRAFMVNLGERYSGCSYNLISKNCNHFCDYVCQRLSGKPIPRWVNRLARLGLYCNCVLPADLKETAGCSVGPEDLVPEKNSLSSRSSRFGSLRSPCHPSSARTTRPQNRQMASLAPTPIALVVV